MAAEAVSCSEFFGHPGNERSPLRLDGRRVVMERKPQVYLARPVSRGQLDRSLRSSRRERDASIDCHWKRESAGVVGVLTDQIHAPRGMYPERGLDIAGHQRKRTARIVWGLGLSKRATSGLVDVVCHDRSMSRAELPSGIELQYETFGNSDDPTLLLVNGYTSQLTGWDEGLCALFVDQGLHVVRYDNRDVGLSSKLTGAVQPAEVLAAVLANDPVPPVPYTLSHMAADGVGLLDHLGVERAHVAGMSMGGMIVQMMAIEHPSRVASLTSIMSNTGNPAVGAPTRAARAVILAPAPTDRAAYIEDSVSAEVWASKRYVDHDAMRARAAANYDRAFFPEGAPRQLAAIYATGDRSGRLRALDVPTLVIHGRDDTLITPSGGADTAQLITGSKYLLLADMGHDLPVPLWPVFVEAIGGHIRIAEAA